MRDEAFTILDSPQPDEPDIVDEAPDDEDEAMALIPWVAPPRIMTGTQVKLTAAERKQVAIWIVEGVTNPMIRANLRAFGVPAVSNTSLGFYRRNTALLDEAREYIRAQVSGIGLSDTAVRVRKLQRHANRLEAMIEAGGLVEIESKVIGWGKQSETIQTQRFAAGLSKEYRATIEQIQKEVAPLQAVVMNTENNIFLSLSMEDQRQMAQALTWKPSGLLGMLSGTEVLEGEVIESTT